MSQSRSIGAERVVLSALFSNPDKIIEVDYLLPEHFSLKGNRYIYMAMLSLYSQNIPIEPSAVYHFYTDDKIISEINEVGGLEYLFTLRDLRSTEKSIRLFADKVVQSHMAKVIQDFMDDYKDKVVEHDGSIDEILAEIEEFKNDLSIKYEVKTDVVKIGDGIREKLDRLSEGVMQYGLSSGFDRYDKMTMGLVGGELTAFGARAKTGKSTVLINMAEHVAINLKKDVLYIDTEMMTEEQEFRMLSLVSGVPEHEFKTGSFNKDTEFGKAKHKMELIESAIQKIETGRLHHVYLPNFTPEKISALAKKFKRQLDIGLLIFDYIKLPDGGDVSREYIELGKLTGKLKEIAGTLNIPVLTAVQLNRSAVDTDFVNESMVAGSDRIGHLVNRLVLMRKVTLEESILGAHVVMKIVLQRSEGMIPAEQIYLRKEGLRFIEHDTEI